MLLPLESELNQRSYYPEHSQEHRSEHRLHYTSEETPQRYLESYKVALGDKTEMHCNVEGMTTSWRRVDGRPFPRGTHLYPGIFVIDVTTHEAAGYYECTVREYDDEIPVVRTEIVVIGRFFRSHSNW